jgi:Tol biopolymer transport system component
VACSSTSPEPSVSASSSSTPAASATETGAEPTVDAGGPWIAYQWILREGSGVFLVRPDGTDSHVINADLGGTQLHPDWSPDGERIAFYHQPADVGEIWISDADGSNAEPAIGSLPPGITYWEYPAWSPDGTEIAVVGYSAENPPLRAQLAIIDVASGQVSFVGAGDRVGPHGLFAYPRWSPDGNALVAAVIELDAADVAQVGESLAVVRRVDGTWSEPAIIPGTPDFASYPDWHPADDLILFTTYDLGAFGESDFASNLYTIRPDGSQLAQITHFEAGGVRATQPTWTPDGRIIFTHVSGAEDDVRKIGIMEADGSGLEVLEPFATHPRLRPTP